MTTFLFANVISSGIKILMSAGPLRRRERFILGCAMALGVGVSMVHEFPLNDLWPAYEDPTSVGSVFRESILMILSTGFVLAAFTAVILNQIIPEEAPEEEGDDLSSSSGDSTDRDSSAMKNDKNTIAAVPPVAPAQVLMA